jgi:hypothetical protein
MVSSLLQEHGQDIDLREELKILRDIDLNLFEKNEKNFEKEAEIGGEIKVINN